MSKNQEILNKKKSKRQLLEEISGVKACDIVKMMTNMTGVLDKKQQTALAHLKYLLYLHSNAVTKDRVIDLKNNGDYLVLNWEAIVKLRDQIRATEEDDSPPREVKPFFEKWCNSFLGEATFYRMGDGNIEEGKKYAWTMFKQYQLEIVDEPMKKAEKTVQGNYYQRNFTPQQLAKMRSLELEGYKGFYCFVNPGADGSPKINIIYNNMGLKKEEYTPLENIPYRIQEIYLKMRLGAINVGNLFQS